jgi:hypothetical protein
MSFSRSGLRTCLVVLTEWHIAAPKGALCAPSLDGSEITGQHARGGTQVLESGTSYRCSCTSPCSPSGIAFAMVCLSRPFDSAK